MERAPDLFTKYTGGQPSMTARGSEPNERSQSSEDGAEFSAGGERGNEASERPDVEQAKGKLFGIARKKKHEEERHKHRMERFDRREKHEAERMAERKAREEERKAREEEYNGRYKGERERAEQESGGGYYSGRKGGGFGR